MTGEGFSTSPLRFKRVVDVETVGFTREIERVVPPLLLLGGTEVLSVVVDFCGDFKNEVEMFVLYISIRILTDGSTVIARSVLESFSLDFKEGRRVYGLMPILGILLVGCLREDFALAGFS